MSDKNKQESDAGAQRPGQGPQDNKQTQDPRDQEPQGPKHGHGRGSGGGV